MTNSRDKGKNGERELCRILSDIFGGSFVRVPNSGAMVGKSNAYRLEKFSDTQGRAFRGDIIPPDHLPNLYVEAKSYKAFRFHQLLQPAGCDMLNTWIKQVNEGQVETDVSFICFKVNLIGWYVVVPETLSQAYVFENCCAYNSPHGRMHVTELQTFFRNNHKLIAVQAGISGLENLDKLITKKTGKIA